MNIQSLQIMICALLLGYPLLLVLYTRRLAKAMAAEKVAAAEAFMTGTKLMAEQLADLTIEVERAREATEAERAKGVRYFHKISDFETERTKWQELYYTQSIGHGNAQQLMMNTIEDLARKLQKLGVRAHIPRVLQAVRDDYLSEHEMPARAAQAEAKPTEATPPTTP